MNFLVNWLISAIAIIITAYLLPGVILAGFWTALIVALILGLINAFIKPVILMLTLPINLLTLGLFTFIINALIILLVSFLVSGFAVINFWWALLFSIIISIVNYILYGLIKD